jgi:ubiquinone/menaquinone biosynthesis C-methylase UbiE
MFKYTIRPGGGESGSPLNLQKRVALISQYTDLQGKYLLDCGCGKGKYVLSFLELGADAWGIDYLDNKIMEYKQNNAEYGHRVSQGDIEKMGYADNVFDIIFLNEVLAHVPDDQAALREIYRVLKPNGDLFIFTPNRIHPFEWHGVYLKSSGKLLHRYIPFIPYLPLQFGQIFFNYWARNYWPPQLRRMVRNAGFKIKHTSYVWQVFENVTGQPAWLTMTKNILRTLSTIAEKLPVVNSFGASQFIHAVKV